MRVAKLLYRAIGSGELKAASDVYPTRPCARRGLRTLFLVLTLLGLICAFRQPSAAQQVADPPACRTLERISVDSDETQSVGENFRIQRLSGDGRYAVFVGYGDDLVGGDTNAAADVFVRDRQAGATERVSIATGGAEANGPSHSPTINGNGQFVAFVSAATTLVPPDVNNTSDVFVRDRQAGITERVNVASDGTLANRTSGAPEISYDGRFVVFESWASNLVPGDTNDAFDIFVHDRVLGTTERVSVKSNGDQATGHSQNAHISADGRYVAFESDAADLVAGDSNGMRDAFVHDRMTGITERVSVASDGTQGNARSWRPRLSASGRFVVFISDANTLIPNPPGDTNAVGDVFVRDRQTGTTERISLASGGAEANGTSFFATDISGDGRFVAFKSLADNLLAGDDLNDVGDIFIHDRQTGTTNMVSLSTTDAQADGFSHHANISADGRFIVFYSEATNLVPDDTNTKKDVFVAGNCLATDCGLMVVRPQDSEAWIPGEQVTIVWTGTVPTGADVVVKLYKGASFVTTVAGPMPNVGFVTWSVPNALVPGSDYWISLGTENESCLAASAGAFTVVDTCTLTVTQPNGSEKWLRESWVPIRWSGVPTEGTNVRLALFKSGVLIRMIAQTTPNDGFYAWRVPADLPLGDGYTLRVSDPYYVLRCQDVSDATFTVVQGVECTLTVAQPNGGEKWLRERWVPIRWSGVPTEGTNVRLALFKSGVLIRMIAQTTPNDGFYAWRVPADLPLGDDYTLRVSDPYYVLRCQDVSDTPFTVAQGVECTLTVTQPNGGETWLRSSWEPIRWTGVPIDGTSVRLALFKSGALVRMITSNTSNDGFYAWRLPADLPLGNDYTIRISDPVFVLSCQDFSNAALTVSD